MTWAGIIFGIWIIIGIWQVRNHEEGWLALMSDKRSCPRPWLVIPSLILCWIFWPIRNLSMYLFLMFKY